MPGNPEPMTEATFRQMLGEFARDVTDAVARLEAQVFNLSQALAEKEHGIDTVRSACQWAGANLASFAGEHHPYDALMQAYKARQH